MNISDLQKEAHAIAKEKGWWDTPRSVGELIALCHSDLSEALREVSYVSYGCPLTEIYDESPSKPAGFPIELADLIIRVADIAEFQELSLVGLDNFLSRWEEQRISKICVDQSIGDWIVDCHADLSQAYIAGSLYGITSSSYVLHLEYLISRVKSLCKTFNIDLDAAIKLKMEYNKTRPYRHGGKKL